MAFSADHFKKHAFLYAGLVFFAANLLLAEYVYEIRYPFIIWSDAKGYYQYLPYLFIKHDITHMTYAYALENGMTLNKYACGTALLEMPFFLVVHLFNKVFGYIDSGFTSSYGYSILMTAVFWAYIGLMYVYKTLKLYFKKSVSFVTVAALYLCSNLLYYTLGEPGMSHIYSFALLSVFIWRTHKFFVNKSYYNTLMMALPLGLAILVRPTNIIYLLLILFFSVYSIKELWQNLLTAIKHYKHILLFFLAMLLCYLPQMLYWHTVTGKFLYYSYGDEGFIYLGKPKLFSVLFAAESGWLVYSPVFILFFAGIVISLFRKKYHAYAILVCFLIIWYLDASWWTYSFACSFGYRAIVEFYPLFAIPLAYAVKQALQYRRKLLKYLLLAFLAISTFANMRMTHLYYREKCWGGQEWSWFMVNKVINKAFYIKYEGEWIKKEH